MIPDLAEFVVRLQSFHNSAWANVFFFHQIMDVLDINDSAWVSGAFVGFMVTLMITLLASDFWHRRSK